MKETNLWRIHIFLNSNLIKVIIVLISILITIAITIFNFSNLCEEYKYPEKDFIQLENEFENIIIDGKGIDFEKLENKFIKHSMIYGDDYYTITLSKGKAKVFATINTDIDKNSLKLTRNMFDKSFYPVFCTIVIIIAFFIIIFIVSFVCFCVDTIILKKICFSKKKL